MSTSHLTLVECDRVMIRVTAAGQLSEGARAGRHPALARAAATWTLVGLTDEVVDLARSPFPLQPVRTLDALHLATALLARSALSGLALLSLDDRIRANARALGFDVLPT